MTDDLTPVPLDPGDIEESSAAPTQPVRRRGRDLAALLAEVVVLRGRRLRSVAARYAGPDEAWDCVHAAVASALERPQLFVHDDPGKLGAWLETATRHEALHVLRRRGRADVRSPEDFDAVADADSDPEADVVRRDERLVTLEALAGLKPAERACLIAAASGHGRAEVAERLGLSERTVARRLLEGRKSLGHFAERYVTQERCRELRPHLSDISDDALQGAALEELSLHLRHCSGCRGQLAALRRERAALGAALPPVLVLPGALDDQPVALVDLSESTTDDAPERWAPAAAGFLARVGAGWEVLWAGMTPLGRLAGAGGAAIGLLFGIGTLWGEGQEPPAEPPPVEAVAQQPARSTPAPMPRITAEPARAARDVPSTSERRKARAARPAARAAPPPRREAREAAAAAAAPAPVPEPTTPAAYVPAPQPAPVAPAPAPPTPSPRTSAGFAGEFLP